MTNEERSQGQLLELRNEEAHALRYYLDNVGVHAGNLLEILTESGAWEAVRYGYQWNPTEQKLTAFLHCDGDRCIVLPPQARFRWPAR